MSGIADIVDLDRYPVADAGFARAAAERLDRDGVLVLADFIRPEALAQMRAEAVAKRDRAYFCAQEHSVYLTPPDPAYPSDHPANRRVISSKGCICDDDIAAASPLRRLYDASAFRAFVQAFRVLAVARASSMSKKPAFCWQGAKPRYSSTPL